MSDDKNYSVSKETLTELLNNIKELYQVGIFLQKEYKNEIQGDFKKEVIGDGIYYRLDKHYKDCYRLINVICNDSGKIIIE